MDSHSEPRLCAERRCWVFFSSPSPSPAQPSPVLSCTRNAGQVLPMGATCVSVSERGQASKGESWTPTPIPSHPRTTRRRDPRRPNQIRVQSGRPGALAHTYGLVPRARPSLRYRRVFVRFETSFGWFDTFLICNSKNSFCHTQLKKMLRGLSNLFVVLFLVILCEKVLFLLLQIKKNMSRLIRLGYSSGKKFIFIRRQNVENEQCGEFGGVSQSSDQNPTVHI